MKWMLSRTLTEWEIQHFIGHKPTRIGWAEYYAGLSDYFCYSIIFRAQIQNQYWITIVLHSQYVSGDIESAATGYCDISLFGTIITHLNITTNGIFVITMIAEPNPFLVNLVEGLVERLNHHLGIEKE